METWMKSHVERPLRRAMTLGRGKQDKAPSHCTKTLPLAKPTRTHPAVGAHWHSPCRWASWAESRVDKSDVSKNPMSWSHLAIATAKAIPFDQRNRGLCVNVTSQCFCINYSYPANLILVLQLWPILCLPGPNLGPGF